MSDLLSGTAGWELTNAKNELKKLIELRRDMIEKTQKENRKIKKLEEELKKGKMK